MSTRFRSLRRKVRLRNFYRNFLTFAGETKNDLSAVQLKTIAVIRRLIASEKSILLISPLSNVHHIEHENVLVRFDDNECHIMNSKYSYYVYLPSKEASELSMLFRKKMENRTNRVVSVYEKKTVQSLQDIIDEINNC